MTPEPSKIPLFISRPARHPARSSLEEQGKRVQSEPGISVAVIEVDTCRKYAVPKLPAAGWDNEPHSGFCQASAELDALPSILTKLSRRAMKTAPFN